LPWVRTSTFAAPNTSPNNRVHDAAVNRQYSVVGP
jgi:hypothetical protein